MSTVKVNEDNYNFLTQVVLPSLRLDGVLDDALLQKMKHGGDNFTINAEAGYGVNGKDMMNYELRFDLSKDDGRYYLNAIKATITREGENISHSHTFPLYGQRGYNVDEMYKMMVGNRVYVGFKNREGHSNGKWSTFAFGSNLVRNVR